MWKDHGSWGREASFPPVRRGFWGGSLRGMLEMAGAPLRHKNSTCLRVTSGSEEKHQSTNHMPGTRKQAEQLVIEICFSRPALQIMKGFSPPLFSPALPPTPGSQLGNSHYREEATEEEGQWAWPRASAAPGCKPGSRPCDLGDPCLMQT